MRTLFNIKTPTEYGLLKSPGWSYVRDGLRRNLGTIIRFHRRNPKSAGGSHFLARLLNAIAIPHSMNIERYFDNVDGVSMNTSVALKMTSSVYKGNLFKGIFYGPECDEIIIAHSEPVDIYHANKNWENLQPVKVLRHPRSDLTMNLPDGKDTGTEYGLAVIQVDIPLLALMYRAFSNNEYATKSNSEPHLTVGHFIHMYVLPNMLLSHLDIAIFNRIDNMQKGAPFGESTQPHSFALIDYSDKVDKLNKEILGYIQKKRQNFVAILRTLPAVIATDMGQVMEMPEVPPTRQITWALVMARLPAVSFLFRAGRDKANTMNQSEINQIRRAITSYRSDGLMKNVLPLHLYYEAELDLDFIFDKTFT